VAVPSVGSNTT